MNTQQEAVTKILADRIAGTESNIRILETRLVAAIQAVQSMRQEIKLGIIERRNKNRDVAKMIVLGVRDEKEIVVPDELRIGKPKRNRGKRRAGGGNRSRDVLRRRWALWKIQLQQGYRTDQIARAWGCNRETIDYARNKGFVVGKR